MKRFLLIAALATVGCGGSDEPGEAVTCEQSDRSGTYWAEFETLSGSCPDQNAGLIRLGETGMIGTECEQTAEPQWSDGDCTLETAVRCVIGTDALVESITITTQQDAAGDSITGTMTFTGYDLATGSLVCSGSYRMTATRQ